MQSLFRNIKVNFFYRIFHEGCMFEHKRSFTDKCTVSRLSHTLRSNPILEILGETS